MLTVPTGWTAEERDATRSIVASSLVSWKKNIKAGVRIFTIGTSTIGGGDWINSSGGVNSDWNKYQYHDESAQLLDVSYERALQQPLGGISQALAEVNLDNTSGRYTPRFMGGSGEMFTAQLPKRPVIINAGFHYSGIDNMIPQFVGLTTKTPELSIQDKSTRLQAADFLDFIGNQFVDQSAMYTSLRSDQVIENILTQLGFSTAQYDLDQGINIINFLEMEVGDKFADIIDKITKAEYGHFYQDEEGKLRFENRQHWDSSPYNVVQRVLNTSQVLEAKVPDTDHIINVVEVKAKPRAKQPAQVIMNFNTATLVSANSTVEIWLNYDDPILALTNPTYGGSDSYYLANEQSDGTGADVTTNISIKSISNFAKATKITFQNNSGSDSYITKIVITGRPAKATSEIYYREQRDASVTAYEEKNIVVENDFIGDSNWAKSLAGLLLNDYSIPENIQEITIRAIPELQLGDLISWQGRYWRIFGIKSKVDPSSGFVQDLKLLQRTIQTYFRIGISAIGGSDKIAP